MLQDAYDGLNTYNVPQYGDIGWMTASGLHSPYPDKHLFTHPPFGFLQLMPLSFLLGGGGYGTMVGHVYAIIRSGWVSIKVACYNSSYMIFRTGLEASGGGGLVSGRIVDSVSNSYNVLV